MFEKIKRISEDFKILGSGKYYFLRKNQPSFISYHGFQAHLLGYWLYKIVSRSLAVTLATLSFVSIFWTFIFMACAVWIVVKSMCESTGLFYFFMVINIATFGTAFLQTKWCWGIPYHTIVDCTEGLEFSFETIMFLEKVRDLERIVNIRIIDYSTSIYRFRGYGGLIIDCPSSLFYQVLNIIKRGIRKVLLEEAKMDSVFKSNKERESLDRSKQFVKNLFELSIELGILDKDTTLDTIYKTVKKEVKEEEGRTFHYLDQGSGI